MRIIDLRPPRIAFVLTAIAAAIHWSINGFWEPARWPLPRVGAVTGSAGFVLMMWSWLLFKKRRLAVCLPDKTEHIAKDGPYRFSRNPMYLGMVLMMAGLALFMGTVPFYLSAIAYFAILNFAFCPYEERKLETAFGEEYEQYRREIRRWL